MTTELHTEKLIEIISDSIINTTTIDDISSTETDHDGVINKWLEKRKHLKFDKIGRILMMPNHELLILIKENFAESFTLEQVARITGYNLGGLRFRFNRLIKEGKIKNTGTSNGKYKLVNTPIETERLDVTMETPYTGPVRTPGCGGKIYMISNDSIVELIKELKLETFRAEDIARIKNYEIGSVKQRFSQLKKEGKIEHASQTTYYKLVETPVVSMSNTESNLHKDLMDVFDKHIELVRQLSDPAEMIKRLQLITKYRSVITKAE